MSEDPGASSGTAQGSSAAYTGKADNYVPVFSNQQRDYKEFRKRAEIYRYKMDLANRSKETVFNLATLMTGKAWDLIEDLPLSDMEGAQGFKILFDRLDRGFQYDPLTELPSDFEAYFIRLSRKQGQTLQEFSAEYLRAERRLRVTHNVELPEKVRAWFFLRKSGISKEQRQLILTNVGVENLRLDAVTKAMNFIIGQDSKLEAPTGRWNKKDQVYLQEDQYDYDDYYEEAEPTYYNDIEEDAPWVDADQAYYEDELDESNTEDAFDVEEFDSVYAAYSDAKARLNMLRTSRGFYPVVAMIDAPPPHQKGQLGKPKGVKKGKAKGKGKSVKGKPSSPQSPISPKGKARGRAAIGRQICLRCGQAGHWARECPTGGEKRKRTEAAEDEVMMVADYDPDITETPVFALDAHDLEDDELQTCNTAVQDGGAASVLGSCAQVRGYLRYLMTNGYNLDELEVYQCKKGFKYGNSETEVTRKCVMLPVVLGGRKMRVLTYVTQGTCPMLFGRPLLEKLGLMVDYQKGNMRWPTGSWRAIPRGPKGEHLLELVEDMSILLSNEPYQEELVPEDWRSHVDVNRNLTYKALLQDYDDLPDGVYTNDDIPDNALAEHSFADSQENMTVMGESETKANGACDQDIEAKDNEAEKSTAQGSHTRRLRFANGDCMEFATFVNDQGCVTRGLPKGKFHHLIAEASKAAKDLKTTLQRASKVPTSGQKLVWEVFAGKGRTTEAAAKMGAKVERFSLADGWNFDRAKDRKKFLKKMAEEQPDEILLSPVCTLWSPLQELSISGHPERRQRLFENRRRHHDEILTFCAIIYEAQRRAGRHCHLEHPWTSRAWKTKALSRLQGFPTRVDQCQYGLELPDQHGVHGPSKKPTRFQTTKRCMCDGLGRTCPGDHIHVPIEGHVPGQGPRSKLAEDYPQALAEQLAALMIQDDPYDEVYAEEEHENDAGGEDGAPQLRMPDADGEAKTTSGYEDAVRKNRELKKKVGSQAMAYVSRLHKNLGHPASSVLVKMLEEVQATSDVLKAAK